MAFPLPELRPIELLLIRYVDADAVDADVELADLYIHGIEPVVKAVLRSKLRVSLRDEDDSYMNQIGLDMLSDVKATLLPVIRRLRAEKPEPIIDSFEAYVKTTALNAYRQYLRQKYPVRLRLRNKVLYILKHRARYESWHDAAGRRLCGLHEWRHMTPISLQALLTESLDLPAAGAPDDNQIIIEAIELVLSTARAPVLFEDLISTIWAGLGMEETRKVSDSDPTLEVVRSDRKGAPERFDEHEALRRLWGAIATMPVEHRRALLLNLTDGKGENLISLLPLLGIASIRQIAQMLEYEIGDFAELWLRLPLNDLQIAEELGVTRQQVINLRQTARAKLRRGNK